MHIDIFEVHSYVVRYMFMIVDDLSPLLGGGQRGVEG